MADSVTYNVVKTLGTLGKNENGWGKEVKLISWNNGIVKLDIRDWNSEEGKMKKGLTFSRNEAKSLFNILRTLDFGEIGDYSGKPASKAPANKGKNDESDIPFLDTPATETQEGEEDDIPESEIEVAKETTENTETTDSAENAETTETTEPTGTEEAAENGQ